LQSFDVHHVKRVTPEQAVRAIDMAGIPLSAEDIKSLREVYVRDDGSFDFRAFIDDVNDHRSNGHFETHPVSKHAETKRQSVSAYVVSPMAGGSAGFFVPLSSEERGALEALLERLRHLCHTRGLVVKQFMHDYDQSHIGTVTVSRFKREAAALFPQARHAGAAAAAGGGGGGGAGCFGVVWYW
jgi:hypothetical protein